MQVFKAKYNSVQIVAVKQLREGECTLLCLPQQWPHHAAIVSVSCICNAARFSKRILALDKAHAPLLLSGDLPGA